MNELSIIQSLWIGKSLSVMEKLCIESFLQNGHPFHLYVYDEIKDVPKGAILKDANTIIPANKIFKYSDYASYAGFANQFRYKLLFEKGNYWVDTDIVCLKPFPSNLEYVFAEQRKREPHFRNKGKIKFVNESRKIVFNTRRFILNKIPSKTELKVNNCVIKAPLGSAIMEYCYQNSVSRESASLKWGETGPKLLSKAVLKFNFIPNISSADIFCPINYWDWDSIIDDSFDNNILQNSHSVHLWNEMWRRAKVDKSDEFSEGSLYEQLLKLYSIRN